MNLNEYFKTKPRGHRVVLAKKLGCTAAYLTHCMTGFRIPSPQFAVAIEKATDGEVSRYDLRPDAESIWEPELFHRANH